MIRSIQKCDEGSDMHNDLTFTLEVVEELGRLKLADALAKAVHIGTQAPGRGGQSGGSRGGGHRGGGQAGRNRMTEPDPIYKEGDDSGVEESWLGTDDWVLSDDGDRTPRCTSGTGVGPSHSVSHEGIIPAQTTSHGASTDYVDPPRMSPQFSMDLPRTLPICRPQFLVDLAMMVDAYLSPHQACPPHL